MVRDKIISKLTETLEGTFRIKKEVSLERPREEGFGDYASSVALELSKDLEKNPREIATQIIENFPSLKEVESITVAGPGFINFKLSDHFWFGFLNEIIEQGERFASGKRKDEKINIEFISCNPTGPMTIANGRGGFTGDVLANLFTFLGYEVVREFYVNDTGNQIKTLGLSLLAARGEIEREEHFYQGDYLNDLKNKFTEENNPQILGQKVAREILEKNIKPSIEKMTINFDVFFSEREMREQGKIEEVLDFLEKKKLTYREDEALFMRTTQYGDDKDRVLKKRDASFTYFASDIAYHWDKFERSDRLINIWGADHHGYIGRILALATSVDRQDDISFLIVQLVRLVSQGKEFKMSKRKGKFIEIKDLIDQVGTESARWFFLQKAANTHLDFDLDLAKDKSEKNPVYYVKYAHARLCGILRKLSADSEDLARKEEVFSFEEVELSLLKEIEKFPEIIEEVAKNLEVHRLCFYAQDLAKKFHKFYTHCPVMNAEREVQDKRKKILKATKIILASVLNIIGVSAPERM